MRVDLVLGPTGAGKTAVATAMARSSGAMVVVMDRIQCYPEIATTSGRPPQDELSGTTRIYLDERKIREGEISALEAFRRLGKTVSGLAGSGLPVIIEGGSLSIWENWHRIELPQRTKVRIHVLRLGDPYAHSARVEGRVTDMIEGTLGRSMLDEFTHAWRKAEQRPFVASIIGFDVLVRWCAKNAVPPGELSLGSLTGNDRRGLVQDVVDAHCAYAARQESIFSLASTRSRPTEVERPRSDPLWRFGVEGESGLGEEAIDEVGPVLDALEPVLHDGGQMVDAVGGEVA
jgi:hypothetical protein